MVFFESELTPPVSSGRFSRLRSSGSLQVVEVKWRGLKMLFRGVKRETTYCSLKTARLGSHRYLHHLSCCKALAKSYASLNRS